MFYFQSHVKDKTPSETNNLFKFKEYISSHTYGTVSVASPIRITLSKPITQYEVQQEIPSEFLVISPKIQGKFIVENINTLVFKPAQKLQPDTKYTVTLKLHKIIDAVPKLYKTYTFSFKTRATAFKISMGNLQSYNKQWQYLNGSIETSDVVDIEQIKQLIAARQDTKNLTINWENTKGDTSFFKAKRDRLLLKLFSKKIIDKNNL